MQCTVCGSDRARKFTRKAEDGKELKLVLCPDCYARLYPVEESDDFITSFVGQTRGASSMACPECGTTLDDFRRTGLLGCAHCYTAFLEELLPTIRYLQGKSEHEGQPPAEGKDYGEVFELVKQQEELKMRIEDAERAGDEGEARSLRAELVRVNKKLYKGED